MTRDHFGFFVFLSCLLIAPEIPLKFMGLAGKSTVSLGIVGLLFWSCVSSGRFIKRKYLTFPFPIKGLILFGAYALGVSLLSLNNVSILYAGQYFLYVCFASFLLNSYIRRAFEMRQIGLSYRIIALVGLAYGLGVIVIFVDRASISSTNHGCCKKVGGCSSNRELALPKGLMRLEPY